MVALALLAVCCTAQIDDGGDKLQVTFQVTAGSSAYPTTVLKVLNRQNLQYTFERVPRNSTPEAVAEILKNLFLAQGYVARRDQDTVAVEGKKNGKVQQFLIEYVHSAGSFEVDYGTPPPPNSRLFKVGRGASNVGAFTVLKCRVSGVNRLVFCGIDPKEQPSVVTSLIANGARDAFMDAHVYYGDGNSPTVNFGSRGSILKFRADGIEGTWLAGTMATRIKKSPG